MKNFPGKICKTYSMALILFCTIAMCFVGKTEAACAGTLFFKAPSSWTSAYVVFEHNTTLITDQVDGYYAIDLSAVNRSGWDYSSFVLTDSSNIFLPSEIVTAKLWNSTGASGASSDGIACPGAGNSVYVTEAPSNPGSTYVGSVPPDAKYFYVKVPSSADWIWATPMVHEQGSTTGVEMKPVDSRCGWFYAVWDQAHVPGVAEVYSKEDPSLMLGDAVPLGALLSDANPKVYYSDGKLLSEDPGINGSCASTQGTALYFLPPSDKEWQSAMPMFRATGTLGALEMTPAPGMCGWYVYKWGVGNPPPTEGYIFRSTDSTDQIGYYGFAGDFSPIPVKQLFIDRGGASLYFIPDPGDWIDDESLGWYGTNPGVDGTCEFKLTAVIYDTDEQLNPLFTSDGNNSGFGACTGIRHGIVKTELGPDKKPVFNEDNENATLCAGDETKFKTLFNYTAGVNEVQCYDMTFRHYGSDPRWGFDSDSAVTDGYLGGFYPVENTSDATVITSVSPQPCTECRTKRYADGPVPTTYMGDFDKYCNTPGWFGGTDCNNTTNPTNSFSDGNYPAVWDWSGRTWNVVKRNQQFCFESHATFTYSEDQEFTFRGDDDIWVFIGGKLAIDNGGAHLAAPGHVVLKNLNITYPDLNLTPGQDYPLDIFFCDRRTTMSNVIIKTNMFIKRSSGLDASATKNSDGSTSYNVCYDRSGDGDCASVALGSTGSATGTIHACGKEIEKYGSLKFSIATRAGDQSWPLTAGQKGMQYGGINLADPYSPKVDVDKMTGLPSGSYRLVIYFCTIDGQCDTMARSYIGFRIKNDGEYTTTVSSISSAQKKSSVSSKTPVGEVYAIPTSIKNVTLKEQFPNTLGYVVKSDMNQFINKDNETKQFFKKNPEALKDVYFDYTVQIFDKQGTSVAKQKGRIYCDDEINMEMYGKNFFNGKKCTENIKNFYISWNMLTDKKKSVSAGEYVAELTSSVTLSTLGVAEASVVDKLRESWKVEKSDDTGIETFPVQNAQSPFHVYLSGKSRYYIVMDNGFTMPSASLYTIMDIQGNVVHQGKITGTSTEIPRMVPGSYMVSVGKFYQQITIH